MSEIALNPGAPPFVKLKQGTDPKDVGDPKNWDGWVVTPTGDTDTDYKMGADYCDVCLRKVVETDSVGALTFTLSSMFIKIANGAEPTAIEKGFLDCLARRASDRRQQLDSN